MGQTSIVLVSIARATVKLLAGTHANKDPGIIKSRLSITNRFKRDAVEEDGFEGEEGEGSFNFSFSFADPF